MGHGGEVRTANPSNTVVCRMICDRQRAKPLDNASVLIKMFNTEMECRRRGLLAFYLLLALLIHLVPKTCAVACPRDIFASVFGCFRYLQGADDKNLIVAGADLYLVKRRCGDGSFNKAVGCIKNLNHVCEHSPRLTLLQHMANTQSMGQGFKIFCDNIFVYGENRECLMRENTEIQRCIGQYQGMFDFEMSRRRDNEAAMMETVCNFLRGMTGCIDKPVRRSCDSALADILLGFMSGITPPVCEPYQSNGARPPKSAIQNFLQWILVVLSVLTMFGLTSDIRNFNYLNNGYT